MERWYVAQTHPHAEGQARVHLLRQGYRAYLPSYRKLRRHARRVETVTAPLFPGYLFVWMDVAATRWRAIRSTLGVRRLICHGDDPVAVPAGVVEDIRATEDPDGLVPVPEPAPFAPGEAVTVTGGALRDQSGWYQRMADRERVVVLLNMLGRPMNFTLPLGAVARAA